MGSSFSAGLRLNTYVNPSKLFDYDSAMQRISVSSFVTEYSIEILFYC